MYAPSLSREIHQNTKDPQNITGRSTVNHLTFPYHPCMIHICKSISKPNVLRLLRLSNPSESNERNERNERNELSPGRCRLCCMRRRNWTSQVERSCLRSSWSALGTAQGKHGCLRKYWVHTCTYPPQKKMLALNGIMTINQWTEWGYFRSNPYRALSCHIALRCSQKPKQCYSDTLL